MIEIDIHKPLFGSEGQMYLEVTLEIKEQSFIALTGKSGSGKTTFLRTLAGLEEAEGTIMIEGKRWLDGKKSRKVQERQIGFVFQEYALFPNMTVLQNLLYVRDDKVLAEKLLEMTELSRLKSASITHLSGGQKQRASLCRAMMGHPKLLLLDEPFSALDHAMRIKLQSELLKMHHTFGTTTIMVSHDWGEIYRLGDRVLVLDAGKILDDYATSHLEKSSFEAEVIGIKEQELVVMINGALVQLPRAMRDNYSYEVGEKIRLSSRDISPLG